MRIWHFEIQTFFSIPKYVCINSKIFTNISIHVNYMLWKFQVIWGSRKKVFLLATFMTPKFRHLQKNGMGLTAQYSEVSSQIYNLFLPKILQYMRNMFKKSLSAYDAWFGFYGNFKKGTFGLPHEHRRAKWVKVIQENTRKHFHHPSTDALENYSMISTTHRSGLIVSYWLEKNVFNKYFWVGRRCRHTKKGIRFQISSTKC